jgi:hypothetical protein
MINIEPNLEQTPIIGRELTATPVEETGTLGGRELYRCEPHDRVPESWEVLVTAAKGETLTLGKEANGWVFDLWEDEKRVILTTDDFGRVGLRQLREAQVTAADHIVRLALNPAPEPGDVDPEKVSKAKGLVSRCLYRDQPAWYTIFELLGKPSKGTLGRSQSALGQLRSAAQSGDTRSVRTQIQNLRDWGMAKRFMFFVYRVEHGDEFQAVSTDWLLAKLHEMDPEDEFEEFIAECWRQIGWDAEVRDNDQEPQGDLGVDVDAWRSDIHERYQVIQAKRYAPGDTLGLDRGQRYMGLPEQEGADHAFLITTSKVSEPLYKASEGTSVTVFSGSDFVEFIREHNLQHVVSMFVRD